MIIASAESPSGARLAQVLLAIVIYGVVARALFTRGILVHGIRGRVERDERAKLYWLHVIFLSGFATLLLFALPRWVFLVWVGVSMVAFFVVMSADRQLTRQATESPYRNLPRWTRVVVALASGLVIVGLIGLILSALASFGALNWLPASFEWPVGQATGVISMPNGYHVVPLQGLSRVQVYDPNWQFVRGWFFEGGNGSFALLPSRQDQFEVFTGALKYGGSNGSRYVFTLDGNLASRADCTLDKTTWNSISRQGTSVLVPTAIWLWPISSPLHSVAILVPGFLALWVLQLIGFMTKPARVAGRQTWVYVERHHRYP